MGGLGICVKNEHSVPRMLINAALSRDYRSKIIDRLTKYM